MQYEHGGALLASSLVVVVVNVFMARLLHFFNKTHHLYFSQIPVELWPISSLDPIPRLSELASQGTIVL